ncbi:hypothetical protein AAVH_05908 [Aphelenchoides avenae]|nr:hypothetical protein AAVH_05908 [Aphelenchus avenae]
MQSQILAGLFLVLFATSALARPAPELPDALGGGLFDVYKRLQLKLFEAEKMRDVPPPKDKDSPPAKKDPEAEKKDSKPKEVVQPPLGPVPWAAPPGPPPWAAAFSAPTGSGKAVSHMLNALRGRQVYAPGMGAIGTIGR